MKHKICISIDKETLQKAKHAVRTGTYRNTSHVFEQAIKQLEVQP